MLYVCLNCVRSDRCRFSFSLSIFFVFNACLCFRCVGVIWQASESGSGLGGPGFDASPYLMPLLGFRLFSSDHVIVRRVGAWPLVRVLLGFRLRCVRRVGAGGDVVHFACAASGSVGGGGRAPVSGCGGGNGRSDGVGGFNVNMRGVLWGMWGRLISCGVGF